MATGRVSLETCSRRVPLLGRHGSVAKVVVIRTTFCNNRNKRQSNVGRFRATLIAWLRRKIMSCHSITGNPLSRSDPSIGSARSLPDQREKRVPSLFRKRKMADGITIDHPLDYHGHRCLFGNASFLPCRPAGQAEQEDALRDGESCKVRLCFVIQCAFHR